MDVNEDAKVDASENHASEGSDLAAQKFENEEFKTAFENFKAKTYALTVPLRIVALRGSMPSSWIKVGASKTVRCRDILWLASSVCLLIVSFGSNLLNLIKFYWLYFVSFVRYILNILLLVFWLFRLVILEFSLVARKRCGRLGVSYVQHHLIPSL